MFTKAMKNPTAYTENGMPTNTNSFDGVLDFFFKAAAVRQNGVLNTDSLKSLFMGAFLEDEILAIRALFHLRNIRGGQSERQAFRILYRELIGLDKAKAKKYLKYIPQFGRWDDVLHITYGTKLQNDGFSLIWQAVLDGDALAAKWCPRENKSHGAIAKDLMAFLRISPRVYRKILASNSKTVETDMCNQNWEGIAYESVPSQAMRIYDEAFYRHNEEGFLNWLRTGKVKASAIFPHEVLKPFFKGKEVHPISRLRIENQWGNLPNYLKEGRQILPVIDVSGSMEGEPMMISVSLGIYLAERNRGPFQNHFFTFSEKPVFVELVKGTLANQVAQVLKSPWGYNTNLEKVFTTILSLAKKHNLKPEDMPTDIIIISDMQFDAATRTSESALDMIGNTYNGSGYKRPNIIFWNVRDSSGIPATKNDLGVSLIAGASPSAIKAVLDIPINESEKATPYDVMLGVLNSEMYSMIQ